VVLPAVQVAAHRPLYVPLAPDQVAVQPGGALVPANQGIGEGEGDLAIAVAIGLQRDPNQLKRRRHRATVLPTHRLLKLPSRSVASVVRGRAPARPVLRRQASCPTGGLHPRSGAASHRSYTRAPVAERTISFARGAPSADIRPHEAVREAAARALESDWQRALSYGTGRGHPELCEWIAELHAVDAEQVMVTNGSMEAAALLFRHLVSDGDRVVVEQPTYDRTLLLLQQAGVELVGAPLEADGVDPAAVEAACSEGEVRLAHVIPNFHNPAGCTLSLEKRSALVQLAADKGFTLFEDDPYRLICFEHERGKHI